MEPVIPRPLPILAPWLRRLTPLALVGLLGSGCVYVYQPMSGLQQPVVVNPQAANLVDVHVTVRCFPGELLNTRDASTLCSKVGRLFENQGAKVTIGTSNYVQGGLEEGEEEAAPATDLVVELRARELHSENDAWRWWACVASYSLLPAKTEQTFAQDVIIRDGSGFLLATGSLQGRIVRYVGVGAWGSNLILNLLVRDEEDKIEQETASEDLSEDMYRQLSQMVFNAKVQWEVMQEAAAGTSAGASAGGAP